VPTFADASDAELSDADLTHLRDEMYAWADCAVTGYVKDALTPQERRILNLVEDDERYALEERAGVLQFGSAMSRDAATRVAYASYLRQRGLGSDNDIE
jgi:hypothetical protein